MRGGMKHVLLYIVIVSIVLLILLFSMSAPIITTNSDFSVYNLDWDGCSRLAKRTYDSGKFTPNLKLAEGGDMNVVQKDITSYNLDANSSSIVILGPEKQFTENEASYLHRFMMNGGKVVLADDFGSGNSLLKRLNTSSKFLSHPVLDLSFEKEPHFGVAFQVREHEITADIHQVLLNKPTGLTSEDAVSLLNSSQASWLDVDEDGSMGEEEPSRRFSLLSVEEYGEGELVLLSDPSVLINSMLDQMDNGRLADNLLSYVSANRTDVIFDESHRDMSFIYSIVYTGDYPSRRISLFFLIGALTGSALVLSPSVKKAIISLKDRVMWYFGKKEEEGDVYSKVLNNHPEWDKRKLKAVYDGFKEKGGS